MRVHILIALFAVTISANAEFAPFVIPAQTPQDSLLRQPCAPITPDSLHLVTKGSHFYDGDSRYRVWGVNVCFAANFPKTEDAPVIADRLAAAGINGVRLHHMDTSRWPRGIWRKEDGKTIEPQALERLDRFIHELAQRGIRVNLNLHVGKEHSRDLGLPKGPDNYDKIVTIFTPKLIDAQKQYAGQILGHVNPLRGKRYADDPAIGFVEITNENSLFMWGAKDKLRNMDTTYAGIVQEKFNTWLKARYRTSSRLKDAWSEGTQPLGENMLKNGLLSRVAGNGRPDQWNLEQHGTSKAATKRSTYGGAGCLEIDVLSDDRTSWHLQFNQSGLKLEAGKFYTVIMRVAGGGSRPITCSVGQAHSPWGNLGLSRYMKLSPEWQTVSLGFTAKKSDDNARVSISFGNAREPLYIGGMQLCTGGQFGLGKGEKLENGAVRLFGNQENDNRRDDRLRFLAEIEKDSFDGMRTYIKKDLGCKALVTGTIVFGPLGLYGQSDMDFIDAHGYWQHPHFPGRPWDGNNWIVRQESMVRNPGEATIVKIAAERMAGKPFTVSEYNHPAPNDYQVECVPMMASFAAAQNWDGIWLFAYSHSENQDASRLTGFFDIFANPGKWGFMQAGKSLFGTTGAGPLPLPGALTWKHADLGALVETHSKHSRHWGNAAQSWRRGFVSDLLTNRFALSLSDVPELIPRKNDTVSNWQASGKTGCYVLKGNYSLVCIGDSSGFAEATDAGLSVSKPDFCAVTLTPLNTRSIGKRYLVTACGRCENTEMGFENDRQTVRRNWGQAPVRVETVDGELRLPEGNWTAYAVGPDGSRRGKAEVKTRNGVPFLALTGKHATIWYVVERN